MYVVSVFVIVHAHRHMPLHSARSSCALRAFEDNMSMMGFCDIVICLCACSHGDSLLSQVRETFASGLIEAPIVFSSLVLISVDLDFGWLPPPHCDTIRLLPLLRGIATRVF